MSKDDESQLTVRVEISYSLWSLDRWTWIRIKMEPQGELQGRSLGNFELSELLPQGCDLDRSSGPRGVTRLPVEVVKASLRLFNYETPTIGSTILREFLRERLFFLEES